MWLKVKKLLLDMLRRINIVESEEKLLDMLRRINVVESKETAT